MPAVPNMGGSVPVALQPVTAIHARKRARPVFPQRWSSDGLELHPKRRKGLVMMREPSPSQHIDASNSRNHLHWGPSVTSAVAAGAAFVSATAAQQVQTGGAIGYQTIGEPTIVFGQTGFRGGETAMTAPNMELEALDHSPISPPLPPGYLPLPAEFPGSDSQAWSLSTFNIANQMSHHPIHPSYGHNIPPEEMNQGHHPCITALSDNTSQDIYHPDMMTSNLGFDPAFQFVQGVYLDQDFAFSPDIHGHKMSDFDELDWSVVHQPEGSGEDVGQPSSAGSSSPSVSPPEPHVTIDGQEGDMWGFVIGQTGDIAEVSGGHATSLTSSHQSPRSPSKTTRPRKGRKRAPLGAGEREQTSNTRRMAACVRCQMQRKRCLPNPDPALAAEGTCSTCCKVATDSKKVIHKLPCIRWKLTSTVLFRPCGLRFTTRPGWEGTAMKNLGSTDWAYDEVPVRTISICLGFCEPFQLRVRKFKPKPEDVVSRYWRDRNGAQHETQIAPYALEDIYKTSKAFNEYVTNSAGAFSAVERFTNDPNVHVLVKKTYMTAWDHMTKVDHVFAGVNVRSFMQDLFKLWFAMRYTLGSAEIVGDEQLGMTPEGHPDYPSHLKNKISVPRMICKQIDSFNFNTMLTPTRKRVTNNLWKLMQVKDSRCFFTVYLAVFILLHEASATSKDRYWHARQNTSITERYDMTRFMEDLHEGTNIILIFWHYYTRGFDPVTADWEEIHKNDGDKNQYKDIKPAEANLMRELAEASKLPLETRSEKKQWNSVISDEYPLIWERDLHFVSHMFEQHWHPVKSPGWQSWTRPRR